MSKADRFLLLGVAFFFVVCASVYSSGSQETVTKTLPARESLSISTGSSKVTVRASQVSEISVEVVYTYSANNFRPVFLDEGNQITLKEEFQGASIRGKASWSVTVPKNTRISCSTGSGDIFVDGVQRDVTISSGSGSVDVEDCGAGVKANTGSGPVTFNDIEGESSISTGSGRIVIHTFQGSIKCNTGSGGANIRDASGSFTFNSGSGDVILFEAVIIGNSSFNSGSGDIKVTLAGSLADDLSLSTGSGKAILNYGGNSIEGYFVFTAREDRGKIVSPFTFDEETTFTQGGYTYMKKSFTRGNDKPRVTISTGSGTAELDKR